MKQCRLLFISLLYWGALSPSMSQVPLPDAVISFARAREHILDHNTGLKSTATEAEAAEAGIAQAGVLPNPEFAVALERFGANEIEATVEQTIELGKKRQLRTDAARKEFEATALKGTIVKLELEAEIVRRFIPIVAAGKKIALLDSMIAIAQATRDQIQMRLEAGASKQTDLIRAEIDIEKLAMEKNGIERENERARVQFAALGDTADTALRNVSGSLAENSPVPSIDSLRRAVAASPYISGTTVEYERLAVKRKELRAEAVPDLAVSAGYLRSNSEGYHAPLVGLSMSLPIFNKNRAAQRQVDLQQRAAVERRDGDLQRSAAAVDDLYGRLRETDAKRDLLRSSTIPKAEQVYAMMLAYYNAGNASFLDLTTARSELLQLRLVVLDLQTERAQILADLMQLTSLPITIVSQEE